jgi:hypothetical protein
MEFRGACLAIISCEQIWHLLVSCLLFLLLVALVVFVTGTAMLWPSYCHVIAMVLLGIAMFLPWQKHGNNMAITWQ